MYGNKKMDEGTVYWLRHIEGQLCRWTKEIEDHTQKLRKANYNSNQPRVPAGQTTGGQWTSVGGGRFGGGIRKPSRNPLLRVISDDDEEEVSPYTTHPYNPMRRDNYAAPIKPTSRNLGFSEAELGVETIRQRRIETEKYIEQSRKVPRNITRVADGEEGLTQAQKESLNRYKSKGKDFKNPQILNYSDGSAIYRVESPARNIPNSYAVYEKHVDIDGRKIKLNKIVIGPDGEVIHLKPK